MRQRQVLAFDFACGDGPAQRRHRLQRLAHHHQPAGVLVKPVHNAGPRQAGRAGMVRQQPVHEGARPVACSRVHHQASRLVDDQHVAILVDQFERQRLRLGAHDAFPGEGASVADVLLRVHRSYLRALRPVVEGDVVTGQYNDGAVNGEAVKGYDADLGKPSDTETFVAIKAYVDNWRWQGVPFFLRTGKRLPERRSEIVIQFKPVPHNVFKDRGGRLEANTLVIRLQPEEYVRLLVMAKEPGLDRGGVTLREVPLDLSLTAAFAGSRRRIAYERLLLDLIEGDQTLFVRRDEVEAQWKWIDAIRALWDATALKPKGYGAGSWGPNAAIALTERDGVSWHE